MIYQSKDGKSTGKSNDILQNSKFWILKHKNGTKDYVLNCSSEKRDFTTKMEFLERPETRHFKFFFKKSIFTGFRWLGYQRGYSGGKQWASKFWSAAP